MSNMNPQMMTMLQQLKANPIQFLLQRRLNLPQNISLNDPNAILNYLVTSGQISQTQINNAYQIAQQMGR